MIMDGVLIDEADRGPWAYSHQCSGLYRLRIPKTSHGLVLLISFLHVHHHQEEYEAQKAAQPTSPVAPLQ